jgi:GTP-binding protein
VYETSLNRISTRKLNESLQSIIAKNPPPAERSKVIRIKYAAQVGLNPTVIILYTNFPKLIKMAYRRYLENQLRMVFDFQGIPIKLSFRKK